MINSNSKGYTDTVLMIRPASFGYNPETALNNAFQSRPDSTEEPPSRQAVREFDGFVRVLRESGVTVEVWQDTNDVIKPDAVFPNNWISFHENGTVITYPMFAENRRAERSVDLVDHFSSRYGFIHRLSFEDLENDGVFLEGTGSMVLDRENKVCYACTGPRTNGATVAQWCELMGYEPVIFRSVDAEGQDIYHTNVVMAVGPDVVVICFDTITDENERDQVIATIRDSGKEVMEITLDQMSDYAGNMLFLRSSSGESVLAVSARAWTSLTGEQQTLLSKERRVVLGHIDTIETIGGGSVRCMLAEVFYPQKP
jgi:hypothetical protein